MKTLGPQNRAFRKRSRKLIFRKRRFGIRIFLGVNVVSGSFLPPFPRRQKMACPSDVLLHVHLQSRCRNRQQLICFDSKGYAFENKTEDGCCCLHKQLYLVVFSDEGQVFCLCFILPLEPFLYHLPPGFANYVHSFLGAQAGEAIQRSDTAKQRKQTKIKKRDCDLSSRLVRLCQHTCRTQRPSFSCGGTFPGIIPRPCERDL